MTNTAWIIDEDQIVHASYCKDIGDKPLSYKSAPKDYVEMFNWLARPDSSGGLSHHAGPSMLRACNLCVPGDA